MGDSIMPGDLKQAVQNLDALPAMPVIALKLLALPLDTEQGERELLLLIEQDPLISAKIIGLANTPLLGTSRKASTVRDATILLGMSRVQSIATGIAIMSRMSKVPDGHFNAYDLWLHCMGIAFVMLAISRAMPRNMRLPDDQVFLAGMLHDIGYLALAFLDSARSDELHKHLITEPSRPLLEIEHELLGTDHAELGAALAQQWNLPEEIIDVVRCHHCPDGALSDAGKRMAQMVNLAEKLLPSFGFREHTEDEPVVADWEGLGIDPGLAGEIAAEAAGQAEQATLFAAGFA